MTTFKHSCVPSFVVLTLLAGARAETQDQKAGAYPAMSPVEQYRIAKRDAEIALARSAAPPSVSAAAEVLVLGNRGYETAVRGTNGYVCFVERSWAASFNDPEFWNPKLRSPNCFNPPAVRSVLPQYLKRTEWVLTGATRQQVIDKARAAFASREFGAPDSGSFSFMLSKAGYVSDAADGPWRPHVMFFVQSGQSAVWSAGLDGSPILGADSGPFEPTILLIPVPRWSDGSLAPPPAGS
jgi:hypothetical protein